MSTKRQKKPIFIIQLLDRFRYGGAERVALCYLAAFPRGLKNEIFANQDPQRAAEPGVKLFPNHAHILLAIVKAAFQNQTVLVCHTSRNLIISSLAKILLWGRIHIVYVRHFQYTPNMIRLLKVLRYFVDKAILITPAERATATQLFGQKLVFVNNFIVHDPSSHSDLSIQIQSWSKGRKVVAFAGAIKEGKYAEHVLELALQLGYEDYCYLIIGDGMHMPRIHEILAQHEGLKDHVMLTGFRNDVPALLMNAHYFFFPSWNQYEMMPMVLLEALSAGCLAFAYDLEVNKEILPPENLFHFQDFKEIAKAIRYGTLVRNSNPYDDNYGKQKLSELIGSLTQ